MKTHFDSIINLFIIGDDNLKELVSEFILAKLESKSFSIVNEYGKRTYEKRVLIYFERKSIKNIDLNEIDWGTFLIQRIEVNKNEIDEWYQVTAPKLLEGNSQTITLEANIIGTSTNTNNFSGFNVL